MAHPEPANVGRWEDKALGVKAAMEFLRKQPGIGAVVLYGHSGGGAVASFYQAVAENGVAFCQAARKLSKCDAKLGGLPAADAVVFADAHPGLGVMNVRMVNPSLIVEGDRVRLDPSLDPYSPANGFNASGPSLYSAAFRARYFTAQAKEMNRLIVQAQKIQRDLAAGVRLSPAAKQVFIPNVAYTNHLDELDPTVTETTASVQPRRLLRNDGSITVQKIKTVMIGNPEAAGRGGDVGESAESFLSRAAVRAGDSMTKVDWCSANSVTVCNTRSIRVPVLFIPAGANNFIADNERMFDASPSKDKEYIVVEGALHGGQTCTKCERTPGQYANSLKNQFDYIAAWINKRFAPR
jgi:pimeloyl-ACP methyl ester carboxylesterase